MAQASVSASRTPDQLSAAELYIAQFAPRTDAYSAWSGEHWTAIKEPLTPEAIFRAFARNSDGTVVQPLRPVSAYFPDREGLTHIAAIDFDTDNGVEQAHRVARRLRNEGATTYIEHSRRGAHLWWPFAEQVTASLAVRALNAAVYMAGIAADPKIELRPENGDAPGPNGYGKALRMPMMLHPKEGKAYPVYDAEGKPLPRTIPGFLTVLSDATPTSRAKVEAIASHGPRPRAKGAIGTDLTTLRSWSHDESDERVTDVARDRWNAILTPGKANRCFAHDDKHPSLNVLKDDQRLICLSPECRLHNNGRGYSARELATLDI